MDLLLTFFLYIGILVSLTLCLILLRQIKIQSRTALFALVIYIAYFLAVVLGSFLQSQLTSLLHWNWLGKLFALTIFFIALQEIKRNNSEFSNSDLGFTLKQEKPPYYPLILVLILLVGFNASAHFVLPHDKIETLLFQSTLPGFDEEFIFRGLLLYLLTKAFVSGHVNFFGARIGWAGIFITLTFGLMHGLSVQNQQVYFNLITTLETGLIGFCLLWARQYSGSLVMPIIMHNLFNLSSQFFID